MLYVGRRVQFLSFFAAQAVVGTCKRQRISKDASLVSVPCATRDIFKVGCGGSNLVEAPAARLTGVCGSGAGCVAVGICARKSDLTIFPTAKNQITFRVNHIQLR